MAIAALFLSVDTAIAQDSTAPRDTQNLEQSSALLAIATERLAGLLESLGYDARPKDIGPTPEIFAASIPYTDSPDVAGDVNVILGFGIQGAEGSPTPEDQQFDYSIGTASALADEEKHFEESEGYTLITDATHCRSLNGTGEAVRFSRIILDGAEGHLCVVVTRDDTAGIWQIQSRSVVAMGEQRLRSYYAIRITVEGNPEQARLLGEERLNAIIDIGSTLANYTLAAAAMDPSAKTTDSAAGSFQRFKDGLERLGTEISEQQGNTGYDVSPEETGAEFVAEATDAVNELAQALGLDILPIQIGLTSKMVQTSFAGRWREGLGGTNFNADFNVWDRERGPAPGRPQDYYLLPDEAACLSLLEAGGRMVYFRPMALDGIAEGHQCVGAWTRPDGTAWTLMSHSLSAAGGLAVLSTYNMTITAEEGTDAARQFGEEGESGMVAVAATLADYGLAAAAATAQTRATEDPAEKARALARFRERLMVVISLTAF